MNIKFDVAFTMNMIIVAMNICVCALGQHSESNPMWLCNPRCHVTTWDWVNCGFTMLTQSHVVMQSTMSCDHMGMGELWIHCVDPIPCGYAIHDVM